MKRINWLLLLSLAGVLFAGYLSYRKFFTSTCALTEGCASFLGLPTCSFGFVLFLLIFIFSCVSLYKGNLLRKTIMWTSVAGMLFSGYFSVYELFFTSLNILNGATYTLLLPSCVYGLVMFVIVFCIVKNKH